MVHGDGLENRFRRKPNVGSNPTPSADLSPYSLFFRDYQHFKIIGGELVFS